MNAKHLVATLALMLAAGATFAALKQGPVESVPSVAAADCAEAPIARIVVTAQRGAVDAAAPVARITVTARRSVATVVADANDKSEFR